MLPEKTGKCPRMTEVQIAFEGSIGTLEGYDRCRPISYPYLLPPTPYLLPLIRTSQPLHPTPCTPTLHRTSYTFILHLSS